MLYTAPAWPAPVGVEKQSGVAKYVTRAHTAYKSCVINLKELEKIDAK